MPRPVVPDSPSMKTVGMAALLIRRQKSRGGGGKARGVPQIWRQGMELVRLVWRGERVRVYAKRLVKTTL